jgi:glycosyltransferase involved in cell wall biosynthesis
MLMEQTLGHVTHYQNLSSILRGEERVEATFLPISYEMEPRWRWLPMYRNWTVRGGARVRKALRVASATSTYDVLFVHTQALATLLSRRLFRRPVVISLDATPLQYDELGVYYVHRRNGRLAEWAKKQINQRQLRAAAHVISWSEWAKRSLVDDYHVDARKISVIAPGVDRTVWGVADGAKRSDGVVTVLFVGGDLRRKGGSDLLAAFGAARARLAAAATPVQLELVLVTAGTIEPQPAVTVHSSMKPNSPELVACYRNADIFCLPTHGDCLPMVLSEASACGLPVISTSVGAIEEIVVHGETGLLVPVGDVAALTDALCQLGSDPALRRTMGTAGAARVAELFDARRNAASLVEVFASLDRGSMTRG